MASEDRTHPRESQLPTERTAGENSDGSATCAEVNCGRPIHAKGYCYSHHRQLQKTGMIGPIRPYRKRAPDTVRFAGLRLSRDTAEGLLRYATKHKISRSAAVARVVESWWSTHQRGEDT